MDSSTPGNPRPGLVVIDPSIHPDGWSFERFVEIIESQAYAPMLSYDSVTYAPARTDDDDARVRVTTRANGTVTGRYEFRLRRQDGGEYDGCWMTDGVQSSTSGSDPGE